MQDRLISYLRDNRDYIIENWLTGADLPLPEYSSLLGGCEGTVPLAFLEATFDRILARMGGEPCNCRSHQQSQSNEETIHLDDFLNVTCACAIRRVGGRVCIELRESGIQAFNSVFENNWDSEEEFNQFERERWKELINHAISATFGDEVQSCQHRHERVDCPFVLN